MKFNTYSFKFTNPSDADYHVHECIMEGRNKEDAYRCACMDKRLKGCHILKSSFRKVTPTK